MDEPLAGEKVPTEEMALVCERNVAQQCGRLPVTDAFVYNPAEAEAVDAALLCSDACRAAVESVDCRGTEIEDFVGELGPTGSTCRGLTCFNSISVPCDLTEERADDNDAPAASCTQSCMTSISSQLCDSSHDIIGIIAEDCAWQRCQRKLEPTCGALDFVNAFGIALEGDVHSWLLQRSAQLCAPECREEWAVLVGTERVPGECSVFSQLQNARQYLDDIVCSCYAPVLETCGSGGFTSGPNEELDAQSSSAACCQTLQELPCRLPDSTYEGDYLPDYYSEDHVYDDIMEDIPPWEEQEDVPAAKADMSEMVANARVETATTHDEAGYVLFDEGDPVAERIARLQQRWLGQPCGEATPPPTTGTPTSAGLSLRGCLSTLAATAAMALTVL
eukprot:jgi/Tetstr1/460586/TSEL_000511.t1